MVMLVNAGQRGSTDYGACSSGPQARAVGTHQVHEKPEHPLVHNLVVLPTLHQLHQQVLAVLGGHRGQHYTTEVTLKRLQRRVRGKAGAEGAAGAGAGAGGETDAQSTRAAVVAG